MSASPPKDEQKIEFILGDIERKQPRFREEINFKNGDSIRLSYGIGPEPTSIIPRNSTIPYIRLEFKKITETGDIWQFTDAYDLDQDKRTIDFIRFFSAPSIKKGLETRTNMTQHHFYKGPALSHNMWWYKEGGSYPRGRLVSKDECGVAHIDPNESKISELRNNPIVKTKYISILFEETESPHLKRNFELSDTIYHEVSTSIAKFLELRAKDVEKRDLNFTNTGNYKFPSIIENYRSEIKELLPSEIGKML